MIAKNVCQDAVGRASFAARQAEILRLSKITNFTWNHSFRGEFWRSLVLTKDNISDIKGLAIMRGNIDPEFPHHRESTDMSNRPLWSEGHYNQGVLDFGDCATNRTVKASADCLANVFNITHLTPRGSCPRPGSSDAFDTPWRPDHVKTLAKSSPKVRELTQELRSFPKVAPRGNAAKPSHDSLPLGIP